MRSAKSHIPALLHHRLEVGESATWAVDLAPVLAFIQAMSDLRKARAKSARRNSLIGQIQAGMQKEGIVGVAELADGRRPKRSRETIR